jgi:hypothetical protein
MIACRPSGVSVAAGFASAHSQASTMFTMSVRLRVPEDVPVHTPEHVAALESPDEMLAPRVYHQRELPGYNHAHLTPPRL